MKICEYNSCNRPFTPTKHWQRFCSGKCRDAYWGKVKPVRRAEPGTFDERRCVICNKRFTPVLKTQKYDRADCRWVAQTNRRRAATTLKTIRLNRMGRPGERPDMQTIDRTIYE